MTYRTRARQATQTLASECSKAGQGGLSPRRVLLVLAVALALRGAVLWKLQDRLADDPDAYRAVAVNLVERGVFAMRESPTAWRPPLYPLALAACELVDPAERWAVAGLHLALGVATVALTLRLARAWNFSPRLATFSALLVAVDPILLWQSTVVMTETLATFLGVVALLALAFRPGDTRGGGRWPDAPRVAWAGVAVGLACLCRPTFVIWGAACGLLFFFQDRDSIDREGPTPWDTRARLWRPGLFWLACLATMSPWIARNQMVFGRPIATTTHGGFTLWLANNDGFYEYVKNGPWHGPWDADRLYAESDAMGPRTPRDEPRVDEAYKQRALEVVRRRPGDFCLACAARVGMFWQMLPYRLDATEGPTRWLGRGAIAAWYVAVHGLALLGLVELLRRNRLLSTAASKSEAGLSRSNDDRGGSQCRVFQSRVRNGDIRSIQTSTTRVQIAGILLLLSFTAMHAVYWSNMRMRAPLVPVVSLLAAAGVGLLARRWQETREAPRP